MRALVCLALAGCFGKSGGECVGDNDCNGGDVCARNGECASPGDVRTVHVTWTIRGMAASTASCGSSQSFYLMFASENIRDTFGFEPVPCSSGLFSVDKLPTRYISVEIGVDGAWAEDKTLDAQGSAAFDLAP